MAGSCETLHNPPIKSSDNCEDVNKVLASVVQKRKTIPTKCMRINEEIAAIELKRLENAKIITEGHKEKEEFRKTVKGFNHLDFKSLPFTLDDLNESEKKLEKLYERMKDINHYLEKRKHFKIIKTDVS